MEPSIIVRQLGMVDYGAVFAAMRNFTENRRPATSDEIWLVEHPPVFTLGLTGNIEHILNAGDIPVIQTDRGGEVTYHGPGQAVIYLLFDLKRKAKNQRYAREFVFKIEQAIINMLAKYHLDCERKPGAPGVYITNDHPQTSWRGAKIAALGLKVKGNGCIYHGLALNVAMDLTPFSWINLCGYAHLKAVDMKTMGIHLSLQDVQSELADLLCQQLCAAFHEKKAQQYVA